MVRQNKTKQKMKAGQVVFGITIGVPDAIPSIVEMLGSLGFDYLDVVCENDLFDESAIENAIRAADISGMTTILRTPYNPWSYFARPECRGPGRHGNSPRVQSRNAGCC